MDLTAIAKGAAKIAFEVAGTAKTAATIHLQQAQAYDFTTDKATGSGADIPVEGVLYKERQARGSEVSARDSAFLVEAADAPDGIETADSLTVNGATWKVVEVDKAAGAAYILRIRR